MHKRFFSPFYVQSKRLNKIEKNDSASQEEAVLHDEDGTTAEAASQVEYILQEGIASQYEIDSKDEIALQDAASG